MQKTFAEVDLKALTHNLKVIKTKTGNKKILAVVKADAYGHGIERVARHLVKQGVPILGTAFTTEAVALREAGITTPILVFFDRENAEACIKYNITPAVSDINTAKRLSSMARKHDRRLPVHVIVDTGMGRVGFQLKKAREEIAKLAGLKNIELEGIMSHFSEADLQDKDFADHQIKEFRSLVKDLKKKKTSFKYLHMSNSAAVLTLPDAHLDMVRPGIMLYGYACCENKALKPVLSLKSSIVLLKKVPPGTPISYGRTFITKRTSTIATIPLGYADGYNRLLSNKGKVLINGRRAPVAGRVCMDTIMVDVTGIPDVDYKSEVVLIGKQGKERITADDIAEKTGTISYEVLTSISKRVQRVYKT